MILRNYQTRGLNDIREEYRNGADSVLYVLPTGGGKTVLFCSLVNGATRKGKRCIITAHRSEIVEQIDEALAGLGVPHGVIAPGYPETPEQVQVASISTLARRLDRHHNFDLIVTDEAHHAVAGSWRRVIEAMPKAKVLGVTATPERLDGRGLGDVFDEMVVGPTTADLIAEGFLSPFSCFAPVEGPDLSNVQTKMGDFAVDELAATMARPVIIGAAVDAYEQHCMGKRAICYGVDVRHSEMLADRFRKRGHRAVHLDGQTPKDERKAMIRGLASGEIEIVCNCGLISEGVDVPAVEAVLLARPTQSLAMYLQQVGRALRIAPGKDRALILDCAGNLWRHGMPDAERKWSLDGKPRKQREVRDFPQLRSCEDCSSINRPKAETCSTCGADLKPTPREMREIAAELQRIEHLKQIEMLKGMRYGELLEWAGADYARLQQVAAAKNYKPGWAWYRLQEQRAA